MEITGTHPPIVIWGDQDGVAVKGIDILEMFDELIGIPASAGTTDAGIDDDVMGHGCYNYT